jgi:hypothetical protein
MRPIDTRVAFILALGSALLAACASTTTVSKPDDVPAAIAVPSASKLAFTLKGSGLQNYECRAKADAAGGYDWVFVSPEAALREKDAIVGRHYAGPTWEYGDGSKVTGKVVASAAAPTAGNIPWLLLQGTAAPAPGRLAGTTYIQRVNTTAGVAPSESCTAVSAGTKKEVRYSADYLFYKS